MSLAPGYSIKLVSDEAEMKEAYRIRHIVFVQEQNCDPNLDEDEYDATAFQWILKHQEEVVGTVRLAHYAPGVGKIGRLAILPEHRGKKLAARLLEELERVALSHSTFDKIMMYAQIDKIGLYEKAGYTVVSPKIIWEENIQHLEMNKVLVRL